MSDGAPAKEAAHVGGAPRTVRRASGAVVVALTTAGVVVLSACGDGKPARRTVPTPPQPTAQQPTAPADQLVVPDVVGLTFQAAIGRLDDRFELVVKDAASADAPAGRIASQTPTGGAPGMPPGPVTITVSTGRVDPAALPGCRGDALRVTTGEPVSEATGQHTTDFVITNVSATACAIEGRPSIELVGERGRVLPFAYSHDGDQMTTGAAPQRVVLAPGQDGYARINKYRCDLHDDDTVATVRFTLLGVTTTLRPTTNLSYCSEPASLTVAVSPVVQSRGELNWQSRR